MHAGLEDRASVGANKGLPHLPGMLELEELVHDGLERLDLAAGGHAIAKCLALPPERRECRWERGTVPSQKPVHQQTELVKVHLGCKRGRRTHPLSFLCFV